MFLPKSQFEEYRQLQKHIHNSHFSDMRHYKIHFEHGGASIFQLSLLADIFSK